MKPLLRILCLTGLFLAVPSAWAQDKPRVQIETSAGTIVIELDAENAPLSTQNFLGYVEDGFYSGTIFHRIIKNFMIQGGGFNETFQKKDTRDNIQNEADNGLKNVKYSIAMARTRDPHSATAQFFINTVDNDFLDHKAKNMTGWGYAVFGMVVEGHEVIDRLGVVPTGPAGPFNSDVPTTPVVVKSASVLERSE